MIVDDEFDPSWDFLTDNVKGLTPDGEKGLNKREIKQVFDFLNN